MPKKMSSADKAMLIAVIVVILFAVGTFITRQDFKLFSIVQDQETQLKQEYNTIWADATDGIVKSVDASCYKEDGSPYSSTEHSQKILEIKSLGSGCACSSQRICYYENDKFQIYTGGGGIFTTSPDGTWIDLLNQDATGSVTLIFKKKYKGQEIALILEDNFQLVGNGLIFNGASPNSYKIILKPHTLEPTRWDIITSGEKVGEAIAGDDGFLTLQLNTQGGKYGRAILHYWGDKAQFSCDLGSNERWIQTQWVGSVSIDDIIKKDGLIPTKFCKETRPFVLRDIQQGETAIFPDPIPDFNRGKTITSPSSNQFIVVNYAVYQVQGLENPTTGTQAYKCVQRDSNYKCLGWIIKEVIKPVEVVVQCKVDSDCPLPLTQFQDVECLNYFKGCQNNKCIYDNTILNAPKCQNQVVTIVKQIQEIDKRTIVPITGTNIFTFSQNFERTSFNIGDKTFIATPSQYLCQVPTDADFLNAPSPSSDCWQTTISYNGLSWKPKDTQSFNIEPIIKVQYFAGGKLTRGVYAKPEHWYNTFIFTIDRSNAMQLDVEDSGFVIKDSIKKIKLQLINNLPNAGIIIKSQQKIKNTNQNLPEQIVTINAIKRVNDIEIDMNTLNLDINTITIQAFYKIKADSEVLIPSDRIILNYDVVAELPSIEKVVIVEKEKVVPVIIERVVKETKVPLWVWVMVVMVVVAGIGFFIWNIYSKQ